MSFYVGLIFWLLVAVLFTVGIVMATKGSMVLLGIATVAFVAAFIKFGCLTH